MLFSNGVPKKDAPFERLVVPFSDDSSRFRFTAQNDYSKQFAHIYAARLGQMRSLLESKAKDKWGRLGRVYESAETCCYYNPGALQVTSIL